MVLFICVIYCYTFLNKNFVSERELVLYTVIFKTEYSGIYFGHFIP